MTNEAPNARVIELVRKLLALANDKSATEAEAQNATEKAMALLAAHNIEMSTIKQGKERADTKFRGGLYPWQRTIWERVARCNFCMAWLEKGTKKGQTFQYRILGSHVNVVSTQVMVEYLQEVVARLSKDYATRTGDNYFSKSVNSFREGLADRIGERLYYKHEDEQAAAKKKRREAQQGTGDGKSLVLIDTVAQDERDANADYLYGEGWSAQQRERQAEATQRYEEARAIEKAWREAHPVEAAQKDAEDAAAYAKLKAEEAKKAKRRKEPTYRAPQYKGDIHAYGAGAQAGHDVSLNRQAGHDAKHRLT